jgi:hypothetical protein
MKNILKWPIVTLNCLIVALCVLGLALEWSVNLWVPIGLALILLVANISYKIYLGRLKSGSGL